MNSESKVDRLLDADEVAAYLNVTTAWVHEQARAGAMPAMKLGRYWRFSRDAIDTWLIERQDRAYSRRSG